MMRNLRVAAALILLAGSTIRAGQAPSGQAQAQPRPESPTFRVAVDYVEDGSWNDPEYLESVRRQGQRITLGEAESRSLSLKPVTP